MTDPTPDVPRPQHLDALARANYVRTVRAQILRDLREGNRSIPAAILGELNDGDADDLLVAVPVRVLLETTRRIGVQQSARILNAAKIPHDATLRVLSPTRRRAIVEVLRHVAPWCESSSGGAGQATSR